MHELRYYLEVLLEHQCSSSNAECPECQSLQRIYQFMQTELFSTIIYSETALDRRHSAQSPSQPRGKRSAVPFRG